MIPRIHEAASLIEWALRAFGERTLLSCSFGGPSGMVIVDLAARTGLPVTVTYVDTGLLFAETYALAERVVDRYGVAVRRLASPLSLAEQARLNGEELWRRDPDACCGLRKVEPQAEALRSCAAWITGIRRDQAPSRADVTTLEWDARFSVLKINPLAQWSEDEVWRYVREFDVPYNELHDRGYPSLGCIPCTRPVGAGEHQRAGRWPGAVKIECGLHLANGAPR